MGGAMSVNDEANYAWLKVEKRWIRRYLAAEKAAIGLCLGAQLIASALGTRVEKNAITELGWTTVQATQCVPEYCFNLAAKFNVMQWHEEAFSLPRGAIKLAENLACTHQAYQIGLRVLAFQFHPEITSKAIQLFVEHAQDQEGGVDLDAEFLKGLMTGGAEQFTEGNQILKSAIDYVLAGHF